MEDDFPSLVLALGRDCLAVLEIGLEERVNVDVAVPSCPSLYQEGQTNRVNRDVGVREGPIKSGRGSPDVGLCSVEGGGDHEISPLEGYPDCGSTCHSPCETESHTHATVSICNHHALDPAVVL